MAIQIPQNVRLFWPSTAASIPAGWVRDTAMDEKFIKGTADSTDPNDTGGAATHTHSGGSHGHTANSHTHSVTFGSKGNDGTGNTDDSDPRGHVLDHSHSGVTSAASSGGNLQSTAVTWAAASNLPPYTDLIVIKPDGADADLEDGIVALWYDSSAPSGWNFSDGNNGTRDLRNQYIRGAIAAGDAGGTGGSLNHNHTVTHGHTADSHSHGATNSGSNTTTNLRQGFGGAGSYAGNPHTHSFSMSGTDTVQNYTNTTAGSGDDVEPAYIKLAAIQNNNGAADQPQYIIGLWFGTLASIPQGWYLCDGDAGVGAFIGATLPDTRGKYIKIINTTGELGNTGGSNTHEHSDISHTHTSNGHGHSGTTGGGSSAKEKNGSQNNGWILATHTHSYTAASATPTYQNNDITCDVVNNEPPYRTAALIMFAGIEVTDERAAKILGGTSSERAAKIRGQAHTSSERGAKIKGWHGGWSKEAKPTTSDIWTKENKPSYGTDIWDKEENLPEY